MSDQETEAGASKKLKLFHEEKEKNKDELPIAGPSNEQPSPKIFKLDIDCFDEIFEYLSLKDLNSFGQTCKAMQKVAGEFFKRNFPNAMLYVHPGEPVVGCFGVHSIKASSSPFNQYITILSICGTNCPNYLAYISSNINQFKSIKKLTINWTDVNQDVTNAIRGCLSKLEIIEIKSSVEVNLYDTILKWCENLNSLKLLTCNFQTEGIPEPYSWMRQKYPKLEDFVLFSIPSIDGLKLFFQNNPNVKTFSTVAEDMWEYRDEIMNLSVQLDLFKIQDVEITDEFYDFVALLNQLYEWKFYKRLHMDVTKLNKKQPHFNAALAEIRGLEILRIFIVDDMEFLPKLPNIKELKLSDEYGTLPYSELISEKLPNLERLTMIHTDMETISLVIQKLPKLKILNTRPEHRLEYSEILKLITLNAERQRVSMAQKITINVSEDTFLKTKWSIGNGDTNLQMIEMKRCFFYPYEYEY